MQRHDLKLPVIPVVPLAEKRTHHQVECRDSAPQKGNVHMQPHLIELQTHIKHLQRDMEEVRLDVKSTRHRLAYTAGGMAVVLGLLGWIANSRFDQLVTLLLTH